METYILLPESQYKKCFPDDDVDLNLTVNNVDLNDFNTAYELTPRTKTDEIIRLPKRVHSFTGEIYRNKKMKCNTGIKRQNGDEFGLPDGKKQKTENCDETNNEQYEVIKPHAPDGDTS